MSSLSELINRKFFSSGISNGIEKLVTVVVTFISLPIVFSYLGVADFGLYSTIVSLVFLNQFLDFGMPNVLVNILSRNTSQFRKIGSVNRLFSFLLTVALVCIFCIGVITWILNLVSLINAITAQAIFVFSTILFLSLPLTCIEKYTFSTNEWYIYKFGRALSTAISLLLTLIGVYFDFGIIFICAATASVNLIANLLAYLYLYRIKKVQLFRSYILPRKLYIASYISRSKYFIGVSLSNILHNGLDVILIYNIVGADQAGVYSVIKRIYSNVYFLQFFLPMLWPAFIRLAQYDYRGVVAVVKQGVAIVSVCNLVIGTCVALNFDFISTYIFSSNRLSDWVLVWCFVALGLVQGAGGVLSPYMNGKDHISVQFKYLFWCSLACFLLQVLFAVLGWYRIIPLANCLVLLVAYVIPCLVYIYRAQGDIR